MSGKVGKRVSEKAGPAPLTNPRPLFRPKLAEVARQCASCPFRADNDAEFGAFIARLRARVGLTRPVGPDLIEFARAGIRVEVGRKGDFVCHHTVYAEDMSVRPAAGWRQCPGATEYFRQGGSKNLERVRPTTKPGTRAGDGFPSARDAHRGTARVNTEERARSSQPRTKGQRTNHGQRTTVNEPKKEP